MNDFDVVIKRNRTCFSMWYTTTCVILLNVAYVRLNVAGKILVFLLSLFWTASQDELKRTKGTLIVQLLICFFSAVRTENKPRSCCAIARYTEWWERQKNERHADHPAHLQILPQCQFDWASEWDEGVLIGHPWAHHVELPRSLTFGSQVAWWRQG